MYFKSHVLKLLTKVYERCQSERTGSNFSACRANVLCGLNKAIFGSFNTYFLCRIFLRFVLLHKCTLKHNKLS